LLWHGIPVKQNWCGVGIDMRVWEGMRPSEMLVEGEMGFGLSVLSAGN
jgi:hypothetical protein